MTDNLIFAGHETDMNFFKKSSCEFEVDPRLEIFLTPLNLIK